MDEDCLILVRPRTGEDTIRTEDIIETIKRERNSIALVMLSGVQYYTGQKFQMDIITREGQAVGAKVCTEPKVCLKHSNVQVGWDLAHAVGNVPLHLNKWGVDFAVWCSYKYLNRYCIIKPTNNAALQWGRRDCWCLRSLSAPRSNAEPPSRLVEQLPGDAV